MRRVSRRRGAGDRGVVSTLPQTPAAVLIGPNSESFGCKLRTTTIPRPDFALAFFSPAKGQH